MKRNLLTIALLVLVVSTMAVAQSRFGRDRDRSRSSSSPTTSPSDNPYDVIAERNMFMRERHRPRDATTRPAPATVPTDYVPDTPERRYVLRGVAIEDGEFRAYFENVRTGEGLQVKPGDAIGNGHVAQIAIDAVAYASTEGAIVWIDVGQNLNGMRDTRSVPSSAGPVASSTPAASSAGPSTGPTDPATQSLEERMRARNRGRSGGR